MHDVRVMFDTLQAHVAARAQLADDEFPRATAMMIPRRIRKGHTLASPGEPCKYLTFVTSGCLRAYSVDERGEEHVVQFALEQWWIGDMYSFLTGKPADLLIEALEETDALLIASSVYEQLCTTVPAFDRYFRILLQNNYIATHRRLLASISMSAEERYVQLIADYPAIVQRVALRHIASYLGITPEALSRIRSRMAKNPGERS